MTIPLLAVKSSCLRSYWSCSFSSMSKQIGIEDARHQLGDIVQRAIFNGQHTIISRYGSPAAAIVPMEWYEAAVAAIGRDAYGTGKEVHHKDGDPLNNDPANLELREPARAVLVGDTYETPEDAAQYAADEAVAFEVLGETTQEQDR